MGHTRAVLDQLETIPGFRAFLSPEEFKANLRDIGLFIEGTTEYIVPVDKELLAEGTDRLVVDVMPTCF